MGDRMHREAVSRGQACPRRRCDAYKESGHVSTANETMLAVSGKTYAQPVLGDVTLSCAAARCWR
jgi:hypothetical protein